MANDASQPKISLGLGGARKARLPINGTKRPHSALDHGGDAGDSRQSSAVSHFDHKAGGAIDEKRPKNHAPLVITSQKNRDWKEASKRRKQRGQLPEESMDANAQIAAIEEAERRERDRTFGLNIMRPDDQNVASTEEDADAVPAPVGESTTTRERTADERAMDALLGNQEQSTLVVAAVSETDAFQDDFRSAPDVATLDDYARVPVEEFGAAMLRGMGWKDGEGVGIRKNTKQKQTESLLRRPALLGIGAKADAAVDAELGGWGKAARGKEIKIYNPVLLKDKKTGELFTEEEAQQKREDAQRLAFEEEFEQREREKRRKARRTLEIGHLPGMTMIAEEATNLGIVSTTKTDTAAIVQDMTRMTDDATLVHTEMKDQNETTSMSEGTGMMIVDEIDRANEATGIIRSQQADTQTGQVYKNGDPSYMQEHC